MTSTPERRPGKPPHDHDHDHDHEFEVLEADEDVPPRPEEAAADLTDGKATPPTKGG